MSKNGSELRMCCGVLGSRKLRQRAQAFTKPKVQLAYGFVPGFQGFLCKYSHSAVSHLWLHLHLYKRVERQSCTGKATQQHQCSWVGYRCRSRAAQHEWTSQNSRTPLLHRVGGGYARRTVPVAGAGTAARKGTHHPGSFSYLQMRRKWQEERFGPRIR